MFMFVLNIGKKKECVYVPHHTENIAPVVCD